MGSVSHVRQKAFISSGLPREMRIHVSQVRDTGATRILLARKCWITSEINESFSQHEDKGRYAEVPAGEYPASGEAASIPFSRVWPCNIGVECASAQSGHWILGLWGLEIHCLYTILGMVS